MSASAGPNLTPAQQATLVKFKAKVKDIIKPTHDDFFLVKWLIARAWDVAKAEKMFREDHEWRQKNDIDNVLTNYVPPEVLTKFYSGGYHGVSKAGFPIWIEIMASNDQKGLYNSVTKKEIVYYRAYLAEKMFREIGPELTKKSGKQIDQAIQIIDLDGLGLKHLWLPAVETYTEILALAEAHYPESLHAAYVINAPVIFPIAFSLVKNFLSEETRPKIKVFGTNYREHLLKDIAADQLPAHWGGTAKDPDGDTRCKSKICIGGTIPEKYYRKNMLTENNDLSKFKIASVQKGSTLQLDYPVTVKKSLFRWNFFTEEKDIGFGVYRRTTPDQRQKAAEMDAVVPSERLNCHVIPEAGSVVCETVGTYVVRFDNSYSWLNDKKVFYLVEVVEPDGLKEIQRLDSTNF